MTPRHREMIFRTREMISRTREMIFRSGEMISTHAELFVASAETTPGCGEESSVVGKAIPIRERLSLDFRAEIFNLYNRVQFGDPGTQLGSATFGIVSSQTNNPRQIQFAGRLSF